MAGKHSWKYNLIFGSRGDDVLAGGDGRDVIFGRAGDDFLTGGAGDDFLDGGAGDDLIKAGAGIDTVIGGVGNDLVFAGSGDDRGIYTMQDNLTSVDVYDGGHGHDTLQINLTHGESRVESIQKDLQACRDILAANAVPRGDDDDDRDEDDDDDAPATPGYTFATFDLTARDWEALEVNLVNTGPTANPDAAETDEDTPQSIILLNNDTDPDHLDELTLVNVDVPDGLGEARIEDDRIIYDPKGQFEFLAVGETADVILGYTISDLAGETATSTVAVTVNGLNDPPVANPDSVMTHEDTPRLIPAGSLLGNDVDPDRSDTLVISSVGKAVNGTVILDGNRNPLFTPATDHSGPAGFEYTISDGHGGTDTATVTVHVEAVADQPDLSVADADQYVDGVIPLDIAAALTDLDGSETLSITIAGLPAGSVLSKGMPNPDGTWTLTAADLDGLTLAPPADSPGEIPLTVTATAREKSNGDTASTTDTMTVIVNRPPVALDDAVTEGITEQALLDFNGTVNLSNYQGYALPGFVHYTSGYGDPDNTMAYAVYYNNGVDGADGAIRRADGSDFSLNTFRARSFDRNHDATILGYSDGAMVASRTVFLTPSYQTFTFGDEWTGVDDVRFDMSPTDQRYVFLDNVELSHTLGPGEDTPIEIDVLANDWDPDPADIIRLTDVQPQSALGAAVTVTSGGAVVYDPTASPDLQALAVGETVADTFDYTIEDDRGATASATVTVHLEGRNDLPVAQDDALTINEDTVTVVPAGELLANDTDPDTNDSLFIWSAGYAQGGYATLDGFGNPRFTPYNGFYGLASFDYKVTDGHGGFDTATVTVTVNPVADAPTLITNDADEYVGGVIPLDIHAALNDPDGSETLSITIAGLPAGSVLSAGAENPDGTWTLTWKDLKGLTLTPPDGVEGEVPLTVTATARESATGDTASTTAGMAVFFNRPPVAVDDTVTEWREEVFLDFVGEDGGPVGLASLSNYDGYAFAGFHPHSIGDGDSGAAFVRRTFGQIEGYDGVIRRTDGRDFYLESFKARASGSYTSATVVGFDSGASVIGQNFSLSPYDFSTVHLGSEWDGLDDVRFDVPYRNILVDSIRFSRLGLPIEDAALTIDVLANDQELDPNDSIKSLTVDLQSAFGAAISINADNTLLYDPTAATALQALADGETETDMFAYTITDERGATSTATVTLTVEGRNDAPLASADNIGPAPLTDEDTAATILAADILGNDNDRDNNTTLSVDVKAASDKDAAVFVNAEGNIVYDPTPSTALQALLLGETATDTVFYRAFDGRAYSDWTTITLSVSGLLDPLFTPDDDAVDFDDVIFGTYIADTQYDSLSGYDTVYLPSDAVEAAEAGFVPGTPFHGGDGNDKIFGRGLDDVIYGDDWLDELHGGDGNDRLYGGDYSNDRLFGDAGNDTLDGGPGNDQMYGGAGDDTFIVDYKYDNVFEAAGEGFDTVFASDIYTLLDDQHVEKLVLLGDARRGWGNDFANEIWGNDTPEILYGSSLYGEGGNDSLHGSRHADSLNGGTGDDLMMGGDGNDNYTVDSSGDTVLENPDQGRDTVSLFITDATDPHYTNYTLGDNLEGLRLYEGAFKGVGNALTNYLYGNRDLANSLYGLDGDDYLNGQGYDDYLDGGAGNDTMYGYSGNDTFIVDSQGDRVFERSANGGNDTVYAYTGYSISRDAYVENLHLLGDASYGSGTNCANWIYGNASLDNVLYGWAGHDELYGGTGNDSLNGGTGFDRMEGFTGNDRYTVDSTGDRVIEAPGGGIDTVLSRIDYTIDRPLGENLENLTLGGYADEGTGNAEDNTIRGNTGKENALRGMAGNDTLYGGDLADELDGGTGDDHMEGGGGSDVYRVDSWNDTVTEALYIPGSDRIETTVDYSMKGSLGVEWLHLLGRANWGEGNALNNTITGNAALDSLGEFYDNRLFGLQGNDSLYGQGGNDHLDGGGGNDWMGGKAGDDTYIVDSVGDNVSELVGQGTDTVVASVSYSLQSRAYVENLTLTGLATDGRGNDRDNTITGNTDPTKANMLFGFAGNDTLTGGDQDGLPANWAGDHLDGGTGADRMEGGGGNDTYEVDSFFDSVFETPGSVGTDTVRVRFTSTTAINSPKAGFSILGSGPVENLTLYNYAVWGQGNDFDNTITGNTARANELYGEGGNDVLLGATQFDLPDYLDGGDGNDRLVGEGGEDTLVGGGGNDILIGGGQKDAMHGGPGNDIYRVDVSEDQVFEYAGGGTDTVESNADYTLSGHVENLHLYTGNAGEGRGNDVANTITGNAERAYKLYGEGGEDRLTGNIKADELDGGADNDELYAGNGNDTLRGGTGADKMYGGGGNDIFYVDDAGDLVFEDAGGGSDTVRSSVDYTLGDNVEDLELLDGAIYGTGNIRNNRIWGNDGPSNVLDGGGGDDTLYAGGGRDTLTGGGGDDLFVFIDNDGDNTVQDFRAGTSPGDEIDLSGVSDITGQTHYQMYTDVMNNHANQDGADTVLDFMYVDIRLLGVQLDTLDQADFVFF